MFWWKERKQTTSDYIFGTSWCFPFSLSLQGQDMADAATICKSNFKVKPSIQSQSSSKTVNNTSMHFSIMDSSALNENNLLSACRLALQIKQVKYLCTAQKQNGQLFT